MSHIGTLLVAIVLGAIILALRAKWRVAVRAEYIRSFVLPAGLYEKLREKRPQLTLKDCQLTGHALRQFFLAHLKSGRLFVSMPSQLADDLWHEFILYTRNYEAFCKGAFGKFLHHAPAAALSSSKRSNEGLRRVWWFACKEENINPRKATRLPLLFALDTKMNIADGFRYSVDCDTLRRNNDKGEGTVVYCGGDFGSASFDGSTDGFGDGSSGHGGSHAGGTDGSGHGCSSGCSSGCGGGGCGGD